MPQIGVDPATGRLTLDGEVLDRNDPRMWGSVGSNVLDISTGDNAHYTDSNLYDPRYYEPYTDYTENGEVTRYRLKPDVASRLGGRTQLSQSGVGGFAEAQDPSRLEWDDEFGILAERSNIKEPDPGTFFDQYGAYLLMAPAALGAIAAAGAAGGLGAGAGALGEMGAEGFLGLGGAGGSGLPGGVAGYGAAGAGAGAGAFGTPGFGAGEWAGILPEAGSSPAMFGTPGFGGAEGFFGADTLGLGGGGGALGTGTSLVGTGLPGVTGPLGSGFSMAGTGLGAGAAIGTGAVAGGAAAGGNWLSELLQDLTGGSSGSAAGGGGIMGLMGEAPKIGEHRQDNDPYGLMASGFGPWSGFTKDAPKDKVTEAMMKKTKVNPWDFAR